MLDLALLYPLPIAIVVMGIGLLLLDFHSARRPKTLLVPVRNRIQRHRSERESR